MDDKQSQKKNKCLLGYLISGHKYVKTLVKRGLSDAIITVSYGGTQRTVTVQQIEGDNRNYRTYQTNMEDFIFAANTIAEFEATILVNQKKILIGKWFARLDPTHEDFPSLPLRVLLETTRRRKEKLETFDVGNIIIDGTVVGSTKIHVTNLKIQLGFTPDDLQELVVFHEESIPKIREFFTQKKTINL